MNNIREEENLGKVSQLNLLKRLSRYLNPHLGKLILCLCLIIPTAILDVTMPIITMKAIDMYILPPYGKVNVKNLSPDLKNKCLRYGYRCKDGAIIMKIALLPKEFRSTLESLRLLEKERYIYTGKGEGASFISLNGKGFISNTDFQKLSVSEKAKIRADDLKGAMNFGILYIFLLISDFFINYILIYLLTDIGQRAILSLRENLYRHLLKLPISFFDKNPVGRLTTRVANDCESINEMFTSVLVFLFKDALLFFVIFGIIFFMDVRMALSLFALAPPIIALSLWFKNSATKAYRQIRIEVARLNTFLQEAISGMSIIQTFVKEARCLFTFGKVNSANYRAHMRLIQIFSIFRPIIDVLATIALAIVLWIGGNLILKDSISIGALIAMSSFIRMLFTPIQDLAEKFNIIQSSLVASERIFKLLDSNEEPGGSKHRDNIYGNVEFRNVSFHYREGEPVLKDISFRIPPGKRIALVGATGSGKTTVVSLLQKFYKPVKGEILLDGKPLSEWDTDYLRSRLSLVQQDIFLFSGNIEDNIKIFRDDVDEKRLKSACEISNLNKIINRFNDGLKHPLNERASTISQGEKQIISFARALAGEPSILILDEATASIDSATEALIEEAIGKSLRDRTALIIAHRLSTITSCDEILVMKKGEIVERGRHKELLEKQGLYANLYEMQSLQNGSVFKDAESGQ